MAEKRGLLVQMAREQAQEAFLEGTIGGKEITGMLVSGKLSLLAMALERAYQRIEDLEGQVKPQDETM